MVWFRGEWAGGRETERGVKRKGRERKEGREREESEREEESG